MLNLPFFIFIMSSTNTTSKFKPETTFFSGNFLINIAKSVAISGLVIYIFYIFLSNHLVLSPPFQSSYKWTFTPTNITHLVFGITASPNSWKNRRVYIESWWRPNMTRGYLFFDLDPKEFLPWPTTSPPFRISEDTSRYKNYNQHRLPHAIRMARVISETFREQNASVNRWYIMSDDDTVFFVDNLVEVLGRYDHTKYFYVGMNSESVQSNADFSFGMAFGGAGYAISYPLAEALAKNLDVCLMRYPTLYGSDQILENCIADLGVSLTEEKGLHQIDLHWDISGFLSAHPQSPLLSLHHLDAVNPIFPSMDRNESLKHLMKAAEADESRLLQQTICYDKQLSNWTFAISWGYSAHIYEHIYTPSTLRRPLETFWPWRKIRSYMFNTRFPSNTSCEAPHVFYLKSVEKNRGINQVVTVYSRSSRRGLAACSLSGNHSADYISTVKVVSPFNNRDNEPGSRRECCDIVRVAGDMNATTVKIRGCLKDEIVG